MTKLEHLSCFTLSECSFHLKNIFIASTLVGKTSQMPDSFAFQVSSVLITAMSII